MSLEKKGIQIIYQDNIEFEIQPLD